MILETRGTSVKRAVTATTTHDQDRDFKVQRVRITLVQMTSADPSKHMSMGTGWCNRQVVLISNTLLQHFETE